MTARVQTFLCFSCLFAVVHLTAAQDPFTFEPIVLDLPNLDYASMAYADIDGDGDLDILATGNTATTIPFVPRSYVARAGDIVPISLFNQDPMQEFDIVDLGGDGLWAGDVQWLDYNLDGILDAIVTGTTHSLAQFDTRIFDGNTRLYRGAANGAFQEVTNTLPDIYGGSVAVGDYDNDGDEDLVLAGLVDPSTPWTGLFRNSDGRFIPVSGARLQALALGDTRWVDLEGDGDLDLFHSGVDESNVVRSLYYINDGSGRFTEAESGLPTLVFGHSDWADFDSDGDLDVALSGATVHPLDILRPETGVYRNTGNGFQEVGIPGLPQIFYGSMGWADYDNDGSVDLVLSGATNMTSGREARVIRQEGTRFVIRIWLPAVGTGSATWADFDGNGVVDLLLTGSTRAAQPLSRLYHNETLSANSRPLPPLDPSSTVSGSDVTLSWGLGQDAQTSVEALTYNLRVGTTPGGSDVMTAHADVATGMRRVSGPGNVWQARTKRLELPQGNYYWSVQAIDQAYSGSKFTEELTFTISTGPDLGTAAEDAPVVEYALEPSYPNPFSGSTTIAYAVREAGPVRLEVYNMLGQRVTVLASGDHAAGAHQVEWAGTGDRGHRLAAGIYFVRFSAGGYEKMHQLVKLN